MASYNNGCLFGRWIEVGDDEAALRSDVAAMLQASPETDAEEWAIHGATRKSHLTSEAERPLVQPFGPSLADANIAETTKVQKGILIDALTGANGREANPDWRTRWAAFPFGTYVQAMASDL